MLSEEYNIIEIPKCVFWNTHKMYYFNNKIIRLSK